MTSQHLLGVVVPCLWLGMSRVLAVPFGLVLSYTLYTHTSVLSSAQSSACALTPPTSSATTITGGALVVCV